MKIVLLSAVALATTIAAPAFAANYTYGANNDGIGTYPVTANVDNFCKLGTVSAAAGNHTSVDGSFATGDANVHVALQDSNDQAQAWSQTLSIDNSICNHSFKISMSSDNGSLKNSVGRPRGDQGANFINAVNYSIQVSFGGASSRAVAASDLNAAGQSLLTGDPAVGSLSIALNGAAVTNGYLLAGTFSDTLRMTLQPNI
jgi:hypothetical protein